MICNSTHSLCCINRWNLLCEGRILLTCHDDLIKALRKVWEGKPAVKTQSLSGQNHQITARWPYRIFLKSKRPLPVCFMTRKTTNPFFTLGDSQNRDFLWLQRVETRRTWAAIWLILPIREGSEGSKATSQSSTSWYSASETRSWLVAKTRFFQVSISKLETKNERYRTELHHIVGIPN